MEEIGFVVKLIAIIVVFIFFTFASIMIPVTWFCGHTNAIL
jgi:hypothetical protein